MSVKAQLSPAPALAALHAYSPPTASPLIDLPLDGTERPVPSADLLSFHIDLDADTLTHYPGGRALEAVLAVRLGVPAADVLVTAGADEALDRACRAMLCPGRSAVVVTPGFEMLQHFAALAGAAVTFVPWGDGTYPVQEVLAACTANTAVIFVVSPNNPTGQVASREAVHKLALGAPQALVVLDGAYAEYADQDLLPVARAHPNVLMVRTLSKAWGLPGIRVGYAVGQEPVMGWLRTAGGPYSVARPSLAVAHARLRSGETDTRLYVERVRHERRNLEHLLGQLGAKVTPSQANFVWAQFADAAWTSDALAALGIKIRAFPNDPQLANHRRITCPGDETAIVRLRQGLLAALRPQALLFDLDGVLADVSRSYRQAIIETARAFDVVLTPSDVAQAKAAGAANNDWILTHRMLLERHVSPSLQQVTEVFEALYQGTTQQPGLRRHETLLCEVAWLESMAARLPLALVTGRPRRDAERFLQQFGILRLFRSIVCMEDAPLKPDPKPVQLALQALQAEAAWMVGDTPDDVRAARGAGVVPLGVVPPGDAADHTAAVLSRCGAVRVLKHVTALEELLP